MAAYHNPAALEAVCVDRPDSDFNNDCRADLLDFSALSDLWLEMVGLSDLTILADFAILAEHWLEEDSKE